MKLSSFFALVVSAVVASASPVVRDLGDGLAYFRVHALPADLPTPAAKVGATVIDLRFVAAPKDSAAALQGWLRFHATATTPVFVLINAKTGEAVREVVARLGNAPGFLSIGPELPEHPADIRIETTPEAERQAYDALEHGAAPETLIVENADKPRHDEATLAQARTSSASEASDDTSSEATPDGETDSRPAAPPVDAALQRAVQLHRALLALGRLPARG